MVSSVRECICACQAGCSRTQFRMSALPQVSGTLSHNLRGQDVFVIVLLVLILVAAVVLTAVWSGDKARRKDALAVQPGQGPAAKVVWAELAAELADPSGCPMTPMPSWSRRRTTASGWSWQRRVRSMC